MRILERYHAGIFELPSELNIEQQYQVQTQPATKAYETVLDHAGCSLKRDTVDIRHINNIRNGTGERIDSQNEVGGWPELAPGTPPIDSDRDGMPDSWEEAKGLDKHQQDNNSTLLSSEGYTNLEVYLNELGAAGYPDNHTTTISTTMKPVSLESYNGLPSKSSIVVYDLRGRIVKQLKGYKSLTQGIAQGKHPSRNIYATTDGVKFLFR
jgi:hypothetical protein